VAQIGGVGGNALLKGQDDLGMRANPLGLGTGSNDANMAKLLISQLQFDPYGTYDVPINALISRKSL
jgi:hypothetical protein